MVELFDFCGAFILMTLGAMFITLLLGSFATFGNDYEGMYIGAWFAACIITGLAMTYILLTR